MNLIISYDVKFKKMKIKLKKFLHTLDLEKFKIQHTLETWIKMNRKY